MNVVVFRMNDKSVPRNVYILDTDLVNMKSTTMQYYACRNRRTVDCTIPVITQWSIRAVKSILDFTKVFRET